VRVRLAGDENQTLLPAEAIMTADGGAGGGEDLVLNAGECRRRIDRFAASQTGGKLFQLSASNDKEKKQQQQFARHARGRVARGTRAASGEQVYRIATVLRESRSRLAAHSLLPPVAFPWLRRFAPEKAFSVFGEVFRRQVVIGQHA